MEANHGKWKIIKKSMFELFKTDIYLQIGICIYVAFKEID